MASAFGIIFNLACGAQASQMTSQKQIGLHQMLVCVSRHGQEVIESDDFNAMLKDFGAVSKSLSSFQIIYLDEIK